MRTYRFSHAPHGESNWVDVGIHGGRRKALAFVKKTYPAYTDWRFVQSSTHTGLIRKA